MEKIFTKKLTKKGFTLAELLIVVAIIAVLVAIAAPLFTGALNDARKAVESANVRSVKGIATAEILGKWSTYGKTTDNKDANCWTVSATWTEKGEIKITGIKQSAEESPEAYDGDVAKSGDIYTLTGMKLTGIKVESGSPGVGG